MPGPEESPIPDPLVWLTYVGADTNRIKLATGVLILPQRNPLVLAKEVATLDVLSNGRVMLGVGVGWLREEFDAIGVPFEERGPAPTSTSPPCGRLWNQDEVDVPGPVHRLREGQDVPKPVQRHGAHRRRRPHQGRGPPRRPPGRRVLPGPHLAEELGGLLDEMHRAAKDAGRDADAIEVTAGGVMDVDGIKRFADLGVERIVIPPLGFDVETLKTAARQLRRERDRKGGLMEILRTPDERFADLPGYPFEPHYVGDRRRRGRHAARALRRRGPPRRRVGAPAPRRAVVVVPLPQDDPGARRRRAARASRRTSSASVAPTSRRRAPSTPTPATSIGLRRPCRAARLSRTSRWSARTGAACSACGWSPSTPIASPRVVAANTFLPTGDGTRATRSSRGRSSRQEVPEMPDRAHRERRVRHRPRPRRHRRLRRAVPRRVVQGGGPAVPAARPHLARRPGAPRQPRGVGGPAGVHQAVRSPPSATATPSPVAATASSQQPIPGAAGQPHTTIEGGGHFIQEDRGEELAAGRRRLHPTDTEVTPLAGVPITVTLRTLAETGMMHPGLLINMGRPPASGASPPPSGSRPAPGATPTRSRSSTSSVSSPTREVHDRTNRLANALAELGVEPGEGVGVMCRDHRGFIDATVALAKLGADTLYLNTGFAASAAGRGASRARAPVALIYDQEFADARSTRSAVDAPVRGVGRRRAAPSDDPTLESPSSTKGSPTSRASRPKDGRTSSSRRARRARPRARPASRSSGVGPWCRSMLERSRYRAGEITLIAAPLFHSWGIGEPHHRPAASARPPCCIRAVRPRGDARRHRRVTSRPCSSPCR